jgi:hypothetical protein
MKSLLTMKKYIFVAFVASPLLCFVHAPVSWALEDSAVTNDEAVTAPAATDKSDLYSDFDTDIAPDHGGHGGGHGGGGHGGGGWHPGHPGHEPFPVHHGGYPWPHWNHPPFVRPVYGWFWDRLVAVTCTAEDSYGELYSVTEDGYVGPAFEPVLPQVEDAALDRCYAETDGDPGCRFVGCTPVY